jgi:hypothetical protein
MLRSGSGLLHELVVGGLHERAPAARPVVLSVAPVLGAGLAALAGAGAPRGAADALRAAFVGSVPA